MVQSVPVATLLLSENFPPTVGGTARWFHELYRRAADVRVVAGEHPTSRDFDAICALPVTRIPLRFADLGVLGWTGLSRYWEARRRLSASVALSSFDWIHCGRLLPEGFIAQSTGRPFGCFVHGEELNTASTSRQLAWMARRVLRKSAFVVANSHHTERLLRSAWNVEEDRVAVLHPGVDAQQFTPASADALARERLGWSDRLVILTVGRLQARKGHDRLIESLGALRDRFPHVLYAILGAGEEEPALRALVRRLGLSESVRFHGEVDDVTLLAAYQQCDLFALPNRVVDGDFEGFGMVILEAQACGKCVVAGNSGGTAEALSNHESGELLEADSASCLAEGIGTLLLDPERRRRMGERGRAFVLEKFDFNRVSERAVGVPGLRF